MKEIAAAMVKAQRAFAPALKTSTNPHFKSKYVSLDGCIDAVIDALNSNGIALLQPCRESEKGATVETLFVHESGETLSGGVLFVPAVKADAQGFGSALTYARRYSLMSACGIAPEDDDGQAAAAASEKAAKEAYENALAAILNAETVEAIGAHLKAGAAMYPSKRAELQAMATRRKAQLLASAPEPTTDGESA